MEKIKLTKREYLGIGNWYIYEDGEGNKVNVPFEGTTPPANIQGYTFTNVSFGGGALLNTANGLGHLYDFYIKNDKYYVYEVTPAFGNLNEVEYTEEDFNKKYYE